MRRSRFLRVYGINPEKWAAQHDLEQFNYPCSACGAMLTTSIPFAYETFRGLVAPKCACGNESTPYAIVRDARYGDLFTGGKSKKEQRR